MKRMLWIALGISALSAGAFAQQEDIDKALLALPAENMKANAMVVKFKADASYDTLKPGSGLVCYDLSGLKGQRAPISVECTDQGNLKRVAQNVKFAGDQPALEAAEKSGTREKPVFGSVWYHAQGADKEHLRTHTTIAMPGATAQSLGVGDKPSQTDIWLMNPGTTTAHLMIPGK